MFIRSNFLFLEHLIFSHIFRMVNFSLFCTTILQFSGSLVLSNTQILMRPCEESEMYLYYDYGLEVALSKAGPRH